MEAETFLSSGFGIRAAIESKRTGWVKFHELAQVWMPGRLKGIQVAQPFGTPFLAATQVYDIRPTPRKWLALERTSDAANRFVQDGQILVTCSGSVGRPTLAYSAHANTLISHDLLRVQPLLESESGWLYAFLNTPQAFAMMTGAKYGHIIKHLEPEHLDDLPVPVVSEGIAADFANRTRRILHLRNEAYRLREEADSRFAAALGPIQPAQEESGFVVSGRDVFGKRRRLEAAFYSPRAAAIRDRMVRFELLRDLTSRVWWMPRFKRVYGDDGMRYLSADELFSVRPQESKRILVQPDDSHREYFVDPGWIVMACSGQVYGLNGAAELMTEYHADTFFSHDLIRIVADTSRVKSGYLLVALTHRTHGRPLLIRLAYGTSIPHLDPEDVADFHVARLGVEDEDAIAALAEASAKSRAEAADIERQLGADAGQIIGRFLSAS